MPDDESALRELERVPLGLPSGLELEWLGVAGYRLTYDRGELEIMSPVFEHGKDAYRGALILAPPSATRNPWLRRFGDYSSGFASGWMLVRGARRRRSVDRGFVLSDHADWAELQTAIRATGASRVLVTHGYVAPMVRWLREQGLDAYGLATRFEGEQDEGEEGES